MLELFKGIDRISQLLKTGHSKSETFDILVKERLGLTPIILAINISEFPNSNDYPKHLKWNDTYMMSFLSFIFIFGIIELFDNFAAQQTIYLLLDILGLIFLTVSWKDIRHPTHSIMIYSSVVSMCICMNMMEKLNGPSEIHKVYYGTVYAVFLVFTITGLTLTKRTFKNFFPKKNFTWNKETNQPTFL